MVTFYTTEEGKEFLQSKTPHVDFTSRVWGDFRKVFSVSHTQDVANRIDVLFKCIEGLKRNDYIRPELLLANVEDELECDWILNTDVLWARLELPEQRFKRDKTTIE